MVPHCRCASQSDPAQTAAQAGTLLGKPSQAPPLQPLDTIWTFSLKVYSLLLPVVQTLMAVCWVILRRQQIYTTIQGVQSLFYIVAKCHFFRVVPWKDIIKYLQKYEGCTHFCETLYVLKLTCLKCPFLTYKECEGSHGTVLNTCKHTETIKMYIKFSIYWQKTVFYKRYVGRPIYIQRQLSTHPGCSK